MKLQQALWAPILALAVACGGGAEQSESTSDGAAAPGPGQSGVVDETSEPNVVAIAAGSPDHKTLVAAVTAAELLDALSNAGPFTVFAPTDAAFAALPEGTVESLVKPENKAQLTDILYYHVYVGNIKPEQFSYLNKLNQVNLQDITIETNEAGEIIVNGKAKIIASVKASNGIVHVIDQVLLPPGK